MRDSSAEVLENPAGGLDDQSAMVEQDTNSGATNEKQSRLLTRILSNIPFWKGKASLKPDQVIAELASIADVSTTGIIESNAEPTENLDSNILTPAEKERLFTEENLAKLSLDEFMKLWREGSPYYCAHATRQGIRDHNFMSFHKAGLNEHWSGLTQILGDGKRLETPFYAQGLKDLSPESLRIFMKNNEVLRSQNVDEALDKFREVMEVSNVATYKYGDKTAVHLSEGTVLDEYYGGEVGNEAFFIFPADYVASQSAFKFNSFEPGFDNQPKDFEERKWNDVWVWPNNHKGLNVDAGLVFLPEDCQVDPETGSKYETEIVSRDDGEKRVVVEDKEKIGQVTEWWKIAGQKIKEAAIQIKAEGLWGERKGIDRLHHVIQEELHEGLSISPPNQASYDSIFNLAYYNSFDQDNPDYDAAFSSNESARKLLDSLDKLIKRPTSTIQSREYWELYFESHPDQKPARIVWYRGTPTNAVGKFLESHQINNKTPTKEHLLGFEKNLVKDLSHDPRSNHNKSEVYAAAENIIRDYYSGEKPSIEGFNRNALDHILSNTNGDSQSIIDFFKQRFADMYAMYSGARTTEQHTLSVMSQFDKYFNHGALPFDLDPKIFKVYLSLHDIKKPEALRMGDRTMEHVLTSAAVKGVLSDLNFSEKEVAIGTVLTSGDPIGSMMKGYSPEESAEWIKSISLENNLPPKELLELFLILYQADASSYTEDAGAAKTLDHLFTFDRNNRTMKFANDYQERVNRIREMF